MDNTVKASSTCRINLHPEGKTISVSSGMSFFDALMQAGISLTSYCGGDRKCGKCRIQVLDGSVSPLKDQELELLNPEEVSEGFRLACCTRVEADVKINIPRTSLLGSQRLQLDNRIKHAAFDPIIKWHDLSFPVSFSGDSGSALKEIISVLEADSNFRGLTGDPAVVNEMALFTSREALPLSVYERNNEVIGFDKSGRHPLGIAFDLGTTKIAAYLMDLETGEELLSTGSMNPQIPYGEDIISRMRYVSRNRDGGKKLARILREEVSHLANILADKAGVSLGRIVEACLVCNTAIEHLLLMLPIHKLVSAPFVPEIISAVEMKARDLDLEIAQGAYVYIPPCIGGFVGSDHVAMLLAICSGAADHVVLGIDIGTNTEVAIWRPSENVFASTSCAAGPAFEGAHIKNGMRAAEGAIEKVCITPNGLEIITIGNELPIGICGSGIIDVVAELLRNGIIGTNGHFQGDMKGIRENNGMSEFVLVPAKNTGHGWDITITRKDINVIQLAKAAIHAGIQTIMETTGIVPEDVGEVVIAGAFGSFLDINSAVAIGLLPNFPNARYTQAGNAAGAGAKLALVSKKERIRAEEISKNTEYVDLKAHSKFNSYFARSMRF